MTQLSIASNPDYRTGIQNVDDMLNEIDYDLNAKREDEESPDFTEFMDDAIARKICVYSQEDMLAKVEMFCALAAISERQKADLEDQMAREQSAMNQIVAALEADVKDCLRRAEEIALIAAKVEAERKAKLEAEEALAKEREIAEKEGEIAEKEGGDGEPTVEKVIEEKPKEVTEKPQIKIETPIGSYDEDREALPSVLAGRFGQLNLLMKKLDNVEFERIKQSTQFEQLNNHFETFNELQARFWNYERLMNGLQSLLRDECRRQYQRATEGKPDLYRQPLAHVYQSLNLVLSEKLEALESKMADLESIAEDNAKLEVEHEHLQTQKDELARKCTAMETQLRGLDEVQSAQEAARVNERKLQEANERIEELEARLQAEKNNYSDMSSKYKKDLEGLLLSRRDLEEQKVKHDRLERERIQELDEKRESLEKLQASLTEIKKENEYKQRLLDSKLQDADQANRSIRYGRSPSPIGGGKSPRLFQSGHQGQIQKNTDQLGSNMNNRTTVKLPFDTTARDDLSGFPQGADTSGDLLDTPRRGQAQKDLKRGNILNQSDITVDFAAQKLELGREKEQLSIEREKLRQEKVEMDKRRGDIEQDKRRIKDKDQEIAVLKDQLSSQNFGIMSRGRQNLLREDVLRYLLIGLLGAGLVGFLYYNIRGSRYPGQVFG